MPRPLDFRTETRAIRFFPFERLFRINQKSNLLNAIRLNFETGYGFGPILIETHYLLQRLKRITLLLRIFDSIFIQIIFTRIYNFVESHLFKLLYRIIFQSLEFITRVMNKINCNFLRIQTKIKREELALRKFKKNFQTRFPGKQYPDNCISLRSSPFFLRHLVYPSFHIRDRNEHL